MGSQRVGYDLATEQQLGEMSVEILYQFLIGLSFLLLSCKTSLYILDVSPLSDT